MSETPSDKAWAKIQEQRLSGNFTARPLTPTLAFDLGFNAGRASVTPPTKETIAEAIQNSRLGSLRWTQLPVSDWNPQRVFALQAASAVLKLFAVPPTESEGKK